MRIPVSDIVHQVRIILDQNQAENSIIMDEDNSLELDEVIRQKALHAARLLLETSDVTTIDTGKPLDGELEEMDGVGSLSVWKLACPDDWLRLLTLKMTDWRRATHATIAEETAEYSQLRSGFIGITGNPERPAVAECVGSDDSRWLEIYTSETGEIEKARYCPIPVPVNEGGVVVLYFPEKLYRHLLYQTASYVAATYKDSGLAQLLMNMVYEGEPESKEEQ